MKKAKTSKSTVSHKGISHGKAVAKGTAMHVKHVGGKGKGGMKPQTSGHIDPNTLRHDAAGHEKGSRGPFTKAETGRHKATN